MQKWMCDVWWTFLSILPGMWSGLAALHGLTLDSILLTSAVVRQGTCSPGGWCGFLWLYRIQDLNLCIEVIQHVMEVSATVIGLWCDLILHEGLDASPHAPGVYGIADVVVDLLWILAFCFLNYPKKQCSGWSENFSMSGVASLSLNRAWTSAVGHSF